jgi:hypothetical protein
VLNLPVERVTQCGEHTRSLNDLLEAYHDGRGFLKINKNRKGVTLNCWNVPEVEYPKLMVFSATCQLEGHQFGPHKDRLETASSKVDYKRLLIVRDEWDGDAFIGAVATSPDTMDRLFKKVYQGILRKDDAAHALVVMPKKLVQPFERYMGECMFADNYEVTWYGRDVGTNAYRHCSEVILLGWNHVPSEQTVAECCVFSDNSAKEGIPKFYRDGRKRDMANDLSYWKLVAQLKQMGARGSCRYVDDDGCCLPMRLTIINSHVTDAALLKVFPNAKLMYLPHEYPKRTCGSFSSRIAYVLSQCTKPMITRKDVLVAMGCEANPKAEMIQQFQMQQVVWQAMGWTYDSSNKRFRRMQAVEMDITGMMV